MNYEKWIDVLMDSRTDGDINGIDHGRSSVGEKEAGWSTAIHVTKSKRRDGQKDFSYTGLNKMGENTRVRRNLCKHIFMGNNIFKIGIFPEILKDVNYLT